VTTDEVEPPAFALARAGDLQAVEPLIEILRQHPKRATRATAAHLLEKLGDARAIPALEAALNDTSDGGFFEQDTPVSDLAADALLAIYHRAGVSANDIQRLMHVLEQEADSRDYARLILTQLNAPVEQILISHMASLNLRGRAAALIILGKRRYRPALHLLLESLTDPEPIIRDAAVLALGALGDTSAFEAVLHCLTDPIYAVRRSAQFALAQVSDERHISALEQVLAKSTLTGFERHDLEKALQAARQRPTPT